MFILRLLATIGKVYLWMVAGAALWLAIAYPISPIVSFIQDMNHELRAAIFHCAWLSMVAIVIGWFIDDLIPLTAHRSSQPRPEEPAQLEDLAPWLQSEPAFEHEDEEPDLLPARKSLPAPERG